MRTLFAILMPNVWMDIVLALMDLKAPAYLNMEYQAVKVCGLNRCSSLAGAPLYSLRDWYEGVEKKVHWM